MEDYLRWLYDVLRGAETATSSRSTASAWSRPLPESIVPHLAGYRGMGPVRVGNQAYEHFQHDVYGNIVLGAAQAFHDHRLFRRADASDFAALEAIGEQAWLLHDQPDAGMWELRTRARVHTSSSLMCWAACDRLAKIARTSSAMRDRAAHWHSRAETIRARIVEQAWNEKRQSFVESFGGTELDASVLLMAEVGFLPPADPRFRSTVLALEDGAVRRPLHAALRGRRRLRPARKLLQRLLVLARRCAGADRPAGPGARAVRGAAGAPQPRRPAVRGHEHGDRRAVGELSRRPIRWSGSSTAPSACRRAGTTRCRPTGRQVVPSLPLAPSPCALSSALRRVFAQAAAINRASDSLTICW